MSELVRALVRAWPGVALAGILLLLGSPLLARVFARRAFFDRYVRDATPEELGAIRILACAILLGSTIWEHLASAALLPADLRLPMGVMRFAYALPLGFHRLVEDASALEAFKWLTALILFLGMAGLGTRIVIPLGALCYLLFGGILRQYSWFYHQGIMPLHLMIVLSFTPCGDGLSVDRVLKIARRQPVPAAGRPAPVYGWARYACWIVIALPYVEAGLNKLRNGGVFWWDAHNLRPIFYAAALEPGKLNWAVALRLTHAPDILIGALGIASILIELCYGAVLFSRSARRVLPYAASCLHVGIFLLQNILFYDMLLLQLVFVDWATFGRTAREGSPPTSPHPTRTAPHERLCPLGVAAVVVALSLVWIFRTEFYPLTAWPMYSNRELSTEVVYTKVYARDESGAVFRASLADAIPALAGTRALPHVRRCADPIDLDDTRLCRRLASVAAAAYNRTAKAGRRIVEFRIEKWSWDLRAFPVDASRATLVGERTFAVTHP